MSNNHQYSFQKYLDSVMQGAVRISQEDRATKPDGKMPMDDNTRKSYEAYRRYKEFKCRVLIEGIGPRGEELERFIEEHLSHVPRVEPFVNQAKGEYNPLLVSEARPEFPNAGEPTHVILFHTQYLPHEVPDVEEQHAVDVAVGIAIFRPQPFIGMMQHLTSMPSTSLFDFAARVAEFVNNCPSNGVSDFISMRDSMHEVALESMRQQYVLPD